MLKYFSFFVPQKKKCFSFSFLVNKVPSNFPCAPFHIFTGRELGLLNWRWRALCNASRAMLVFSGLLLSLGPDHSRRTLWSSTGPARSEGSPAFPMNIFAERYHLLKFNLGPFTILTLFLSWVITHFEF